MRLKDGSDVPDAKVAVIMDELQRCTRHTRRLLRPGAYGHRVDQAVLEAHPVLLNKGKLSAAAAAVIACAVRQDGSLVSPKQE